MAYGTNSIENYSTIENISGISISQADFEKIRFYYFQSVLFITEFPGYSENFDKGK
jgi:hypothetical protein